MRTAGPAYRGRVTALWPMAPVGSTPTGSPVVGTLPDVAGPVNALAPGAAWRPTGPAHRSRS
jgi:hypothetical protein